jgi:DNA-binding IclR family transcriptional regulator
LISSFDKGLSILDFIVHADRPPRLQDVANCLGIDKSSALRFLATLQKHALVERHPRHKTFSVGMRLTIWSKSLGAENALVESARPFLERLTESTGQTSHLAVLRDDCVALVEVVRADSAVSVRQTPGDWEPLYCTAVGKAILAFLPTIEQRRLIEQITFRAFTDRTIDSRESMRVELRDVVHRRIAFDDAEKNPQIFCIAAPVLDRSGYPIASLGISSVAAQHTGGPRAQRGLIAVVREAAGAVTHALNSR